MRLVYLHQYFCFPDKNGGTRSYDLAKEFVANGIAVDVITSSMSENHSKFGWSLIERDGIRVHVISLPYDNKMSFFKRKVAFVKFSWLATLKLLSLRCDLVLATSTPLTIALPALVKKFISGTPYIFEVRDVWPEAVIAIGAVRSKTAIFLLESLERFTYRHAAAIVALSTDMRDSIVRRSNFLKDESVKVIENISEIDRFKVPVSSSKPNLKKMLGFEPRFAVLYAGAFGRVNGLRYAVDLARRFLTLDPTITFVLIGDGAEKEIVREYACSSGVFGKNLYLLDPVPKNMLPELYAECDLGSSFVLNIPELWANSANKFFDSLAAGRPVLINYGGWQKKVIAENLTGFALAPEIENIDEADLVDIVEYSFNERAQTMRKRAARAIAEKKYSLQVASSNYLDIINQLGGREITRARARDN